MRYARKFFKTHGKAVAVLAAMFAVTGLLTWQVLAVTLNTTTLTVSNVQTASQSNYKAFSWKWLGYNDEKVIVNWPHSPDKVGFRMSYPRNGTVFKTLLEGVDTDDIVTTTTQSVFTVDHTNMPPAGQYYCEFLEYDTTTAGVVRIIARGKVTVEHSVWENTTQSTWTNPLAGTQIGPPIHTLTAESNWPFLDTNDVIAGANITITTNASANTLTIAGSAAATAFGDLTDVNTNAPTDNQYIRIASDGTLTNEMVGGSTDLTTANTWTVGNNGGATVRFYMDGSTDDGILQYSDGSDEFQIFGTGGLLVPGLSITNAVSYDDALTNILVRAADGTVKGRAASTLLVDTNAVAVRAEIRNTSGGAVTAGQAVYITGYNAGQDRVEVDLADSDAAAPANLAYGLVQDASISNNANGYAIRAGRLYGVDTSSWSVNDPLYVSTTAGALTNVRPSARGEAVQKIGVVLRSHATLGVIDVQGAGRSNDESNDMDPVRIAQDGAVLGEYLAWDGSQFSPSNTVFSGSGTTGTVTSAAGDAGKFLKADGTWAAAGGGGWNIAAPGFAFVSANSGSNDQWGDVKGYADAASYSASWRGIESAETTLKNGLLIASLPVPTNAASLTAIDLDWVAEGTDAATNVMSVVIYGNQSYTGKVTLATANSLTATTSGVPQRQGWSGASISNFNSTVTCITVECDVSTKDASYIGVVGVTLNGE